MPNNKLPPGTWIEREMFESEAYLSLSGFAPQLLTLILGKRQFRKVGKKGREKRVCINCDKINITYAEFMNTYGISQPRLTRAKKDLLEKGFLTTVYRGGTYRQDKGIYALSDNWLIWQPGMDFASLKNKSRIRKRTHTHQRNRTHKPLFRATKPYP